MTRASIADRVQGTHRWAGADPRILVVDDVEANRAAMRSVLADMDCEVVEARSGNDALRQLLKAPFAVVLLDVQMPEMDGYEVAFHARDNPLTRDVPIIFLTASNNTEDTVLRGYGSGAVDFLFKPVDPYVLRSKVGVFFELYAERRRIAEALENLARTNAELARANQELDAFAYSISHDLRAPLRAMDGFGRALLEGWGDKLDVQGTKYLTYVRDSSQHMGQMIDALLAMSQATRSDLCSGQVDLTALAQRVIGDLRATEPRRQVEVSIENALRVEGDEGLLVLVLQNLLGNAWKFTAKREHARIELGRMVDAADEDRTTYFVRDNGAGFDQAYSAKLFGVFKRLHSPADFQGTGVGLATVRRIVQRHGGRVWAEGEVDRGASFYFTIGGR